MKKTFWSFRMVLTGIVLLVVSVAGATWLLNSGPQDAATGAVKRPPGLNPRTTDSATSIGYVDVPSRVVPVSPIQAGRVEEVLVQEDQEVKAGEVLLKLDDRTAQYNVQEAEAMVKDAESELEEAKKLPEKHDLDLKSQAEAIVGSSHKLGAAEAHANRAKNLRDKIQAPPEEAKEAEELKKVTQSLLEVEKIKLQKEKLFDPQSVIKKAQANLDAKKAKLGQAQYLLKECKLLAPGDGRILRILIGRGELVSGDPKQSVIQFAPREPRIIAEVEQEFANRVHVGQAALIEDDSHADVHWTGKVSRISDWYTPKRNKVLEPLQNNDVRTLECIIQLDPGQKEPRIGQRVRVTMDEAPAK